MVAWTLCFCGEYKLGKVVKNEANEEMLTDQLGKNWLWLGHTPSLEFVDEHGLGRYLYTIYMIVIITDEVCEICAWFLFMKEQVLLTLSPK